MGKKRTVDIDCRGIVDVLYSTTRSSWKTLEPTIELQTYEEVIHQLQNQLRALFNER